VSAAARAPVAEFYKAWDRHGCLSNFSPHPICMAEGPMTAARLRALLREGGMPEGLDTCGLPGPSESEAGAAAEASSSGSRGWASVEHYYQAQKYVGVANPEAAALVEAIAAAPSPEQAAALGRRNQFLHPELVREDWDRSKLAVMYAALRAKFATHIGPRQMLLSSAAGAPAAGEGMAREQQQQQLGSKAGGGGVVLVESSPHDFFWGRGFDGSGQNMLGKLLMWLREEMVKEQA
jgi:diaminohydroxyphosphoribosylaminopyrimidine deaminase/5-amino-6-(5-phosphoribosylamino)uracil reductase